MSAPKLSHTQRKALQYADADGALCEPELYLECDAGGLTIYNVRRAVDALHARGLLAFDRFGDSVITDAGRDALAQAGAK